MSNETNKNFLFTLIASKLNVKNLTYRTMGDVKSLGGLHEPIVIVVDNEVQDKPTFVKNNLNFFKNKSTIFVGRELGEGSFNRIDINPELLDSKTLYTLVSSIYSKNIIKTVIEKPKSAPNQTVPDSWNFESGDNRDNPLYNALDPVSDASEIKVEIEDYNPLSGIEYKNGIPNTTVGDDDDFLPDSSESSAGVGISAPTKIASSDVEIDMVFQSEDIDQTEDGGAGITIQDGFGMDCEQSSYSAEPESGDISFLPDEGTVGEPKEESDNIFDENKEPTGEQDTFEIVQEGQTITVDNINEENCNEKSVGETKTVKCGDEDDDFIVEGNEDCNTPSVPIGKKSVENAEELLNMGKEVEELREQFRDVSEELQARKEELSSLKEDLQQSIEERDSAKEELESMKAKMEEEKEKCLSLSEELADRDSLKESTVKELEEVRKGMANLSKDLTEIKLDKENLSKELEQSRLKIAKLTKELVQEKSEPSNQFREVKVTANYLKNFVCINSLNRSRFVNSLIIEFAKQNNAELLVVADSRDNVNSRKFTDVYTEENLNELESRINNCSKQSLIVLNLTGSDAFSINSKETRYIIDSNSDISKNNLNSLECISSNLTINGVGFLVPFLANFKSGMSTTKMVVQGLCRKAGVWLKWE